MDKRKNKSITNKEEVVKKGAELSKAYDNPKISIEDLKIKISEDAAREYAESIINTVREPLIALNQDLRVVSASRSFYEVFKVKPEETVGQLIYDLGNKQWDIPKLRELLETILPEKTTFDNYEVEHDFATIGRRIMLLNARQIQRVLGKERIILLAIEDITERKQAEEALLISEERYRLLVENANETILVVQDGILKFVNQIASDIIGYSKKELISRSILEFIHPDDRNIVKKQYLRLLKGEVSLPRYDFRLMAGDNSIKWVDIGSVLIDWEGRPATLNFLTDITERKKAEENLKNSNERLKKMYSFQDLIRKLNQFLLKCDNEDEIYQKVCDTFMESDLIKFVWIGLTEEGTFNVKPAAYAGIEKGFINSIKIKWDNSKYGRGPTGTAIKTRNPVVIGDIRTDPAYMPWRKEAIKRNYLSIISLPLIHEGEVMGALDIYSDKKDAFIEEDVELLKEVGNDIAIGVKSIRLEKNLQKKSKQLEKSIENIIFTMAKMSESKDLYTTGHQQRISQLTTAIARKMGLSEDRIESLKFASLIHDIGKFSIPGEILSKPAKLSETEFALIKEHPKTGYNIIKDVDFPWEIAPIILQHHERLDGSGYPEGLKDKKILLESKILAVADVVEAMSSHRPYRPALGIDKALEEISMNKGKLYDPEVVDTCIKLFKEDEFKFE